jgi:sugar-specific transcriptional regulator TrmB
MEHTTPLQTLGLTSHQATVYALLVREGAMTASVIARKTGIARTLTYYVLEELETLALVQKDDPKGKIATFTPLHPVALEALVAEKRRVAEHAEHALGQTLTEMTALYNVAHGKPGVQVFEGISGARHALWDTLTQQQGEVYSYVDIAAVQAHIPELNAEYVAARKRKGVRKKLLVLDTPSARAFIATLPSEVTDTRLLRGKTNTLHSAMNIYNGKISYISAEKDRILSVIIENKAIYDMHAHVFLCTWELAQKIPPVE